MNQYVGSLRTHKGSIFLPRHFHAYMEFHAQTLHLLLFEQTTEVQRFIFPTLNKSTHSKPKVFLKEYCKYYSGSSLEPSDPR